MSRAPDIVESSTSRAAPALHEIARGMELKKCRKCGCMKDALDQAGRAFESSEEPEIRSLLPRISDYQARMGPLAYDCIGCKNAGVRTLPLHSPTILPRWSLIRGQTVTRTPRAV